jgi:heptosyltransferase-2
VREPALLPWRRDSMVKTAEPGDLAPRRIMVRAPNPLGDAVLAEPALRAVAERFPEAVVEVHIAAAHAPLARMWPFASRVWPVAPQPARLRAWHRLRTVRALRGRRYDLALILPNSRSAARYPAEAGIPRVVGYDAGQRTALLTLAIPVERRESDPGRHMIEHYWALAEAMGAPTLPVRARLEAHRAATASILAADPCTAPRLVPDMDARAAGRGLLAPLGIEPGEFLVFAPGAGYGPAKRWPAGKFAGLAEAVVAGSGRAVLLVGSEAERSLGRAITAACGRAAGRVVDLMGRTSLEELIGILALSEAFVGNDSGPAHIAAALGKPTVAIFGSTSAVHSAPVGPLLHLAKLDMDCSPCFEPYCPLGHTRCLTELSAERVAEVLRGAFRTPHPER